MKFKTKQERVSAAIHAFEAKFPGPFTINQVSSWVMANGLYPIPKRGDSPEDCLAWEERLDQVTETSAVQA